MAEDMIISEIEKFQKLVVNNVNLTKYDRRNAKVIIREMKLLVSLMGKKKLEERMSSRVNYLISDVVDMAREAYRQLDFVRTLNFEEMTSFRDVIMTSIKLLRELDLEADPENAYAFDEGDVVGFEGDLEELLHEINSMDLSQHQPFFASIEGIAGSGKTTLARQLYDHADIVRGFEPRVWVNCTEILSRKELLVNMVGLVANGYSWNDVEEMERTHLQEMLAQQLQNKRFFIVLDDIRGLNSSPYFLDDILKLYSSQYSYGLHDNDGKGRSIILLTCRTNIFLYSSVYHHYMKPLDVEMSWQLLLECMSSKFPKHSERKGKSMLMKHSGGLPLAIKEVALEWAEKHRLGIEWEEVVESEDLELRATLKAIDSSVYHNLKPVQKLRFLLLSLFKLGTTIRARKLLQIWVAAGVAGLPRKQKEYPACLKDLVHLNIIEKKDFTKTTQPKNVHVSSIFHKLSITKAIRGDDGEKDDDDDADEEDDDEGSSLRLRVIFCSRERLNSLMDENEKLNCVSFSGGGCFNASPSYWKSFEKLRVLDFEGFGLTYLPETVGELIELRYLGFRDNYIQELPHSLGNLKKLEVLDIALNFMVKVPDIIWEMNSLVHLYMSDIFCMKPLTIEALKNLETLTYISIDNWAYEESGFRKMKSLSKLGIDELDENSNVSKLFASLAALKGLKNLLLRGFRFRSMPSLDELGVLHRVKLLKIDGLIIKLPSPESFPPCLVYLTLDNSRLDKDPMPVLEELPNLKYLKLQNAYTGQEMVISEGGFPKLGCMIIGELWHLRNIKVGEGALVRLRDIEISNCPFLPSILKEMITSNIAAKIKDYSPI